MGIGVGIFLVAIGAILAFAVNVQSNGIDLNAVGVILMLVGAVGIVVSMFMWDRLGWGGSRTIVRDRVVDDRPVRERQTVTERDVV